MHEKLQRDLEALARKRGLRPADAEDAASEAMEALLKCDPPPDDPGAYAKAALRNLISTGWRRKASDERKAEALEAEGEHRESAAPDLDLATLEELASLAGAIEQVAVWDSLGYGGDSTHFVVESLHDIDVEGIKKDLAFLLHVIELLPYTSRHRRNKTEALQKRLRSILDRCRYEYAKAEEFLRRLPARPPEAEPAPAHDVPSDTGAAEGGAGQEGAIPSAPAYAIGGGDYYLTRGMLLASKLCPRLPLRDAMFIAWKARVAVFGLPDDESGDDDPTTET